MNIFSAIDRDLERPGTTRAMLAIFWVGLWSVVGLVVVGVGL